MLVELDSMQHDQDDFYAIREYSFRKRRFDPNGSLSNVDYGFKTMLFCRANDHIEPPRFNGGYFGINCPVGYYEAVSPGGCIEIHTGLFLAIPVNCIGIVGGASDSGFECEDKMVTSEDTEELVLMLNNISNETLILQPFERLARLLILKTERTGVVMKEADNLLEMFNVW